MLIKKNLIVDEGCNMYIMGSASWQPNNESKVGFDTILDLVSLIYL